MPGACLLVVTVTPTERCGIAAPLAQLSPSGSNSLSAGPRVLTSCANRVMVNRRRVVSGLWCHGVLSAFVPTAFCWIVCKRIPDALEFCSDPYDDYSNDMALSARRQKLSAKHNRIACRSQSVEGGHVLKSTDDIADGTTS